MQNAEEIAYWNSEAGSRWARLQERMDRAFAPLDAALLARARPALGERVLDVGCGCGASSLELAAAVGPPGRVVGIDVSQPMLAVAERRARTLGIENLRFTRGDVSIEPFGEPGFDLVFSRFGVMFFDEPVPAFANLRRPIEPKGRLAFVCWRDLAANPWFHVPRDAVLPFVAPQERRDATAPGPLAFADPARVREILVAAGFANVRIEPFDASLRLGSRELAIDTVSQIGPTSRLLDDADDVARARALVALDRRFAEYETDGDVVLGAGVWLVTATAC